MKLYFDGKINSGTFPHITGIFGVYADSIKEIPFEMNCFETKGKEFQTDIQLKEDIESFHELKKLRIYTVNDVDLQGFSLVMTDENGTNYTFKSQEAEIVACKFRSLELKDVEQIKILDEQSEISQILPFIQDMLEEAEEEKEPQVYAFGVFMGDKLLSYCTIGGADEIKGAADNDLLLGDVFVLPDYRFIGLGKRMVSEILKLHANETVWITIIEDDLADYYNQFGFSLVDMGLLVKRA